MTLQEIAASDRDVLLPTDIAGVLGCNPYSINIQAQDDPKKLGFPVIVIRRTVRIPRIGFLRWFYNQPSQDGDDQIGGTA